MDGVIYFLIKSLNFEFCFLKKEFFIKSVIVYEITGVNLN